MARLSAIALLAALVVSGSATGDDSPETFFELKVRPLLATKCLPCHGGKKTSSGLKVDSRDALLRGGDRGAGDRAGRASEEPADSGYSAGRRRPENAAGPAPCRLSRSRCAHRLDCARRRLAQSGDGERRAGEKSRFRHWAFQRVKASSRQPIRADGRPLRSTVSSRPGAGRRACRLSSRRSKRSSSARDVRPDRSAADAGRDQRLPG